MPKPQDALDSLEFSVLLVNFGEAYNKFNALNPGASITEAKKIEAYIRKHFEPKKEEGK